MNEIFREPFGSLGEYLAAVIGVETFGIGTADSRLEFASSAGLEEGVPSRGGFLVPTEFSADLHERLYTIGAVLNRCTPWPATRENFIVPMIDERSRAHGSRFGGVTMSWTQGGSGIAASKPKFAAREMNRRKLAGAIYVVNEMLADVSVLEAVFTRLFALEGAFVIENEIIVGGGAVGPLGILSADCTVEVAKESGQTAATVVASNIINMFERLWGPSKSRAVWLVNTDVTPQLYGLTWASGTGVVPLFQWADDGMPLLLGRPVLEIEQCPTLGERGDIILADLGEYLITDIEEISIRFSGDAHFINDESAFKFRLRVDGHPAWSSAVEPLNGTSTVSPFVTLEAR